jgi:hypothetical protein
MSLAEFQRALCDLIASPEMCLRARHDPTTTLAEYDITERERMRLDAVVRQRGMSTNCSLYRVNRVTPIYSILPLTCELLGDGLLLVITEFWQASATDLQTKHEVDLFADWLRAQLASGRLSDPYLDEVLSFEQAANTLRFMPRNAIRQRLIQAPPMQPALHPLVRVAAFAHDPMTVLEPLADRRRPPPGLPIGEYYLLLDARVEYAADLVVTPLEPDLGRALPSIAQGDSWPRTEILGRLVAAGVVVAPDELATVSADR